MGTLICCHCFVVGFQGFGVDGNGNTHRICNSVAGSYDAPLADNELPLNSNWKCGNPGVYVFHTTSKLLSCQPRVTVS